MQSLLLNDFLTVKAVLSLEYKEDYMKEFELKYGCNPNQRPSRIYMSDGSELPIEILCGRPGYINFLDAFNSWQLVQEPVSYTHLHIVHFI